MQILIVEDSENFSGVVVDQLDRINFPGQQVITATTIKEGRDISTDFGQIVLLDLGLPDSPPEKTIKEINYFVGIGCSVVVVTGWEKEYWKECIEAGALLYVPKSYLLEGILGSPKQSDAMFGLILFNAYYASKRFK